MGVNRLPDALEAGPAENLVAQPRVGVIVPDLVLNHEELGPPAPAPGAELGRADERDAPLRDTHLEPSLLLLLREPFLENLLRQVVELGRMCPAREAEQV